MAGLRAVVAKGDRAKSLEAIRDALASELEVAEGPAAAVLARELRLTLAEIDATGAGQKRTALDDLDDELAGRRAKRRSVASGS